MTNGFKLIACVAIVGALAARGFSQTESSPRGGAQAIALTLDEAIARALANQPLIEEALEAVRAAQSKVGEAESSYYPNVSGVAAYEHLEPNQVYPLDIPALGIDESLALVPQDSWDFHLGLNEVIYAFGRRGIEVRLAENGVEAARIGADQVETSLAYQTALTFYAALFLREQTRSLDDQLADLNEHLSVIEKRADTGSATKYDVLSTRVQVASLESQRINVANQYAKQEIALKQLTGVDPSEPVTVDGSFGPGPVPGDERRLVAQALAGRAEVMQARTSEDAAALSRQAAEAAGLPTVAGSAEAGYKNGIIPNIYNLTLNGAVGLTVNVPIFAGFQTEKQIEQADAALDSARDNAAEVQRRVVTEVLQAVEDVEASRREERTAEVQLDQAQQALDAAKVQYDLGVITNDEYLSSQDALEQAQLARLLSVYQEVQSDYELKQAIGEKIWN